MMPWKMLLQKDEKAAERKWNERARIGFAMPNNFNRMWKFWRRTLKK
jgi:hypothetical protein